MSIERFSRDPATHAIPAGRRRVGPKPLVTLALTVRDTTRLVEVRGEVDMSSAHLLVEFVELFCAGHTGEVRLDLSGVTFFSAHGISSVLRVQQAVTRAGGRLTLHDPAPCVRRLLALAGANCQLVLDGRPCAAARPSPRRPAEAHPVPD